MSDRPSPLPPAKGDRALAAYTRHHWDLDVPELPDDLRVCYAAIARCLACIGWGRLHGRGGRTDYLADLLDDLFEAYRLAELAYGSVRSQLRQPAGVVDVLGSTSPSYSRGAMRFISRAVAYARDLGPGPAEIALAVRGDPYFWTHFGQGADSFLGKLGDTEQSRLGDVAERVLAELRRANDLRSASSEGIAATEPETTPPKTVATPPWTEDDLDDLEPKPRALVALLWGRGRMTVDEVHRSSRGGNENSRSVMSHTPRIRR